MFSGTHSCKSIFAIVVMSIALLMGLLAIFISPQYIDYLIMFSKFFEAMIPVLAVGALVKYIGCPSMASCCHSMKECEHKKESK